VQIFESRSAGSLDSTVDSTLSGNNPTNYLGASVAGAGDVNLDGYGDMVVGAYGYNSSTGRVYVFHGTAAGLISNPSTTLTGQTVGDQFGWAVAPAGDVNKDGYSDVIIGAPRYSSAKGRAYIYHGSSTGLRTTYTTVLTGATASDLLGTSVSGAGDVNSDRYSDVIVGAPGVSSSAGAAYVHHGSSTGVSTTISATLSGSSGGGQGTAVAAAGDVNGDGYADVVVGAPSTSGSTGAISLHQGSSTGVNLTATVSISGSVASGSFGSSLAGGDVNGDGYSDVLVGAPGENSNSGALYVYSGSSGGLLSTASTSLSGQSGSGFGTAVASPGDTSGDGYDDVVVGAPLAGSSAGFAALYLGSSSGLSSSSSLSFSGATSGDLLGQAVGGGDVNGDGAVDIFLGIPAISSNMGAVQVVHGARGTFGSSASNTLSPGTSAQLGYAVAGAGDVNHDGFEDVIVGAPGDWSSAGAAWIFHGSSSGMSSSPATALYGKRSSAFGAAVAGVGDLNQDGYDDVAIGAPIESSGSGAVYIYAGSS
ncbi:MAG TPA: FG-GAP-like repeat-containing protein, partial [Myxococcota bacterium]|nr:FG-GAP-like repeat-containing protein [Myxococcota bacterium]